MTFSPDKEPVEISDEQSIHRHRNFSSCKRSPGIVAGHFLVAFVTLAFSSGYVLRPDTVTSDRSGYWIAVEAGNCRTFQDCFNLGFPSGFYGFINLVLPVPSFDVEHWDILLALVGATMLIAFALWVSRIPVLTMGNALFFLAASALCAMYIFMLSKDCIQAFIFFAAFLFIYKLSSINASLCLTIVVFALEGFTWRPYFYIVACFIMVFFIGIGQLTKEEVTRQRAAVYFMLLLFALLVFSFALQFVSPSNYSEIVDQHGVDREIYTSVVAASGIKSVIPVTSSSPVPLFVLNWVINTFRLLFPIELFSMGAYYIPFALYQLYISCSLLRTLSKGIANNRVLLCISVYLAFVLASGAFEPDFGSWVRHETACLPFLMVAVTGYAGHLSKAEKSEIG